MKIIFYVFAIVLFALIACNTSEKKVEEVEKEIEVELSGDGYNAEAAKEFGADNYGMKRYVMAFLKAGPNRPQDSTKAAELQAAHMANIGRMAEEGKLVLAGPFLGEGELRGIYVFDVPTIKEAEALTNTDPAVQAGSLVMELKEWYGSAALIPLNDIHKTLTKEEI